MNRISTCTKIPAPKPQPNPPFGAVFSPHLLRMELSLDGNNNFDAEIVPFNKEEFSPGTAVLHYGQSIFEGMKAFAQADGSAGVFRADLHASRFRRSAQRMVMADIPEEVFIHCLKTYVSFERDSIPDFPGHSLYLRPLLFGADPKIKMGPSQKYWFYIMSSAAGTYFGAGGHHKAARVLVNREFVRAYPGGLGEVKTAANYAASIWPQRIAQQLECDQVLYLDAVTHDSIDEMGGMNFFVVEGDQLITPELNGCILHGVTRRSILEIASSIGLKPVERKLSFTEVADKIESGKISEAFACGTAAVVSPIGELLYQDKIGDKPRSIKLSGKSDVSMKVLDTIQNVQRGKMKAPGDWILSC